MMDALGEQFAKLVEGDRRTFAYRKMRLWLLVTHYTWPLFHRHDRSSHARR